MYNNIQGRQRYNDSWCVNNSVRNVPLDKKNHRIDIERGYQTDLNLSTLLLLKYGYFSLLILLLSVTGRDRNKDLGGMVQTRRLNGNNTIHNNIV